MTIPVDSEHFEVYAVSRTHQAGGPPAEAPPGEAVSVDSDQYGNVIFRRDPVPADKVREGLQNCIALARMVIGRAAAISSEFQVETITLKLAIDAEVGMVFVCDASLEAGIEIEIKRVHGSQRAPAS